MLRKVLARSRQHPLLQQGRVVILDHVLSIGVQDCLNHLILTLLVDECPLLVHGYATTRMCFRSVFKTTGCVISRRFIADLWLVL